MSGQIDYHIPVLAKELLAEADAALMAADPTAQNWIVDATLGDGGHSLILRQKYPLMRLLGSDRDPEMLARATARLKKQDIPILMPSHSHSLREDSDLPDCPPGGIILIQQNYRQLAELLERWRIRPRLILLDLGVASYHFKAAGRGFSYLDEELDMRFDPQTAKRADLILNHSAEAFLSQLFYEKGEERYARRVARAIVDQRPIKSARKLAELAAKAIPYPHTRSHSHSHNRSHTRNRSHNRSRSRLHPATRIFQALRIAVNDELTSLQEALEKLPFRLAPKGILAVISFHSLEDRIVKNRFRQLGHLPIKKSENISTDSNRDSQRDSFKDRYKDRYRDRYKDSERENSGRSARQPRFQRLNRRPLRPSPEETASNPAARSARMRLLQRLQ